MLAPAQFSKHTPPFGRVDPGAQGQGEPPANKILLYKPTPRSNFCLLAPIQFFTIQGFSDGVTIGGTPGGQHLGSPPCSVLSPGEMRSPRQILGFDGLCEPGSRPPDIHTYTHTHIHTYTLSSLYSRLTIHYFDNLTLSSVCHPFN